MHGRLKVKTTAQQEAEKKANRQRKVKEYKHAMEAVAQARKQGHLEEAMKVSAAILMANPDISTMWNIRKEVILKQKKKENV